MTLTVMTGTVSRTHTIRTPSRIRAVARPLAGAALIGALAATLASCGSLGSSSAPATTTVVVPAPDGSGQSSESATGNAGPQPTVGASQGQAGAMPAGGSQGPAGVAGQGGYVPDSHPMVQSETFTTYQAQGNASEAFAQAVFYAFVANYNATGDTWPTLSVTSPTTGQTYTMTCTRPQNRGVGCVGGDDAAVLIY